MSCIIASNFIDDQPMTTMMCCTLLLLKGDGKGGSYRLIATMRYQNSNRITVLIAEGLSFERDKIESEL